MSPGTSWAFSPDGNFFAIGHLFSVDVWDLKMGKWLSRFTGMDVPEFRIGAVTFSGATTVAFLSNSNLAVVCVGALGVLDAETNLSALVVKNPTGTPKERLEIRALAVSADGNRLAVAGMRMASRHSFGDPGAGPVFDVPEHGEIQVWEAFPLRLLVTIQGSADEKFSGVALDPTGNRVAAITTGVRYTPKMNNVMQQGAEHSPTGPYRVVAWDVK
jgi:WD40 repeat protein